MWLCLSLGHVQFFAPPWSAACWAPLSMEFSRQEYWSRLPFPFPGDHSSPGIEPMSLASPTLAGGFFFFFKPLVPPGKPLATNLMWGERRKREIR